MKSYIAKPQEVERKWYVVDAEGKTLGRLASEVASILRGKKKPIYTPHVDTGDYVIVINAEKIEVTGKKRKEKIYKRHTGYPGGLREITFEKLQAKKPEEIVLEKTSEIASKQVFEEESVAEEVEEFDEANPLFDKSKHKSKFEKLQFGNNNKNKE